MLFQNKNLVWMKEIRPGAWKFGFPVKSYLYIEILRSVCPNLNQNTSSSIFSYFLNKSDDKSYSQNLNLKAGGTGAGEGGLPLHPPFLISRCLYRILNLNLPNNCPIAFQWPEEMNTSPCVIEQTTGGKHADKTCITLINPSKGPTEGGFFSIHRMRLHMSM